MQSEIVGALSPPVSEFKPTKPVINFQASAIPTNYKEMIFCFIFRFLSGVTKGVPDNY